ncbi:MAG: hypothetical protein ACR2MW_03400, partial [Chthoniobacterales bacterium]
MLSLPSMNELSAGQKTRAGLLAGAVAGVVMTFVMLLLASLNVATPLVILGDRLSVFIPPGPFLAVMGRVGGYTHLKELGVSSVIIGQIVVGALGGWFYGGTKRSLRFSLGIYFLLPLVVSIALLWPQLGTSYAGFPIRTATLITCLGLALSFLVFERTLVLGFWSPTRPPASPNGLVYSPAIGRRALVLGGLGLLAAGGGAAVLRQLFQVASFSYDGTQYKGAEVQGITPTDKFYCVTKNVIDPQVDPAHWRLEVTGLVRQRQTYNFARFQALPAVAQETT